MKSLAAILLLALTAVTAQAETGKPGAATVDARSVINQVKVEDGAMYWDIFRLGMTLEELQTRRGTSLTLTPGSEGVPTTDRYAADLTRHGINVHIAFESDDPGAALVFLRAAFPQGGTVNTEALTASLKSRSPELETTDGNATSLLLPGSDYHVSVKPDGLYMGAVWLFE